MRVHVIGAGVAGMAAALAARAGGAEVLVHEAAGHCGGRARSFHDRRLEREIDNGNHLMLSGNGAVRRLAAMLGSEAELEVAKGARFSFLEVASGRRWALELDEGPVPFWLFDAARRVPETSPLAYLKGLKLLLAGEETVAELFDDGSPLWRRFWEPFAIGVLNTPPEEAAARLLLPVIARTLARGGRFSRPMVARRGLSHLFARPFAARAARDGGLDLRLHHPLRGLETGAGRLSALLFAGERLEIGPEERVILALPPAAARRAAPFLMAPGRFSPIVNVHYAVDERPEQAERQMHGILGGLSQWVFSRPGVVSVTISAASAQMEMESEEIARACWPEAAAALDLDKTPLPPFRVIREKRATFAATAAALARRAPSRTGLKNLFLAGDWVNTDLPATIEGAAASGFTAAELALA